MKVVTPASRYDVASCVGPCQMMVWQCLKLQLQISQTWAARDDNGETVLVAGISDAITGTPEAWFLVSPKAARHLAFLIRQIRLTLEATAYPRIDVKISTCAGARIARLVGFSPVSIGNGLEVWRYGRDIRRGRQQRGCGPAKENCRGKSAQAAGGAGKAILRG